MGALTMCYLDFLQAEPDPTSEKVREGLKTKCQEWFLNSDTRDSLNDAYRIWDSVSCSVDGVRTNPLLMVPVGVQRRESCW